MDAPSGDLIQTLHKMCGSVEVARDLVDRSEVMYEEAGKVLDARVVDSFERAAFALALVAEALRGQLRSVSLGPAA